MQSTTVMRVGNSEWYRWMLVAFLCGRDRACPIVLFLASFEGLLLGQTGSNAASRHLCSPSNEAGQSSRRELKKMGEDKWRTRNCRGRALCQPWGPIDQGRHKARPLRLCWLVQKNVLIDLCCFQHRPDAVNERSGDCVFCGRERIVFSQQRCNV